MLLTYVDPHVSEIVMVCIQSGDLLMVCPNFPFYIFRRLATSLLSSALANLTPPRRSTPLRRACARHTRGDYGHGGSPPESLLYAIRAHQQQCCLLQWARPEVAQGLGAPHRYRHRHRRVRGRELTRRQQGGSV
jgi:hypothetical protein